MSAVMLTEDQTAALQEIANIGMGKAGASIARIWKEFVHLSVPSIAMVESQCLPGLIQQFVGEGRVSAARQAFHGNLRGEVLVVLSADNRAGLAALMGYHSEPEPAERRELVLDIANILVGACLNGIAQQLNAELGFSAPSLIGEDLLAADVVRPAEMAVEQALCLEVRFKVETHSLAAHLVVLMPPEEVASLAALLDQFLCTL